MKKGHIPNRRIADAIALPPGVLGHLDWTTGAVRLNLSFEEYHRIRDSSDWLPYQEVLLHEYYHGLQICSSGYLYNFIVEFTYQLWEFGIEMDSEELNMKKKMYEPIVLSSETTDALSQLHDKKAGLSVVDLVESAAFIAHNLMFEPEYDQLQYLRDRERYAGLGTPYFSMYDYLEPYLGEDAFYWISSLAFYSLLFGEPVKALHFIVDGLAGKEITSLEATIALLNQLKDKARKEIPYLGAPVHNLTDEQMNYLHPFYSQQIKSLRQMLSFDTLATVASNSRYISLELFDACLRPLIFNCSTVYAHQDFGSAELTQMTADEQLDHLKVLNALSYKAFNDHQAGLSFFKPLP